MEKRKSTGKREERMQVTTNDHYACDNYVCEESGCVLRMGHDENGRKVIMMFDNQSDVCYQWTIYDEGKASLHVDYLYDLIEKTVNVKKT